jgi:HD-GYP domain-containing protein (c-di-GMP phosphodiesterase class II)
MRVPSLQTRAFFVGTVAAGAALIAVGIWQQHSASVATLALLGAAVLVAELIQVSGDESSFDPADSQSFSFSSGIHLAAVLIIGPWTGGLVAAFGVLVADSLRGKPWRRVAFNASVFALSAVASGYAFIAAGGSPGTLELPRDFPALAMLAIAYYGVNTLLVSSIVALHGGESISRLALETFRTQLPSTAGETGLGVAVAFLAVSEPWAIVALIPLGLAVYQSLARLTALRRETARALETFANVVDERDPYTFRHSARVAGYVRELAEALELPATTVSRLWWAGRLHDLGKIAVDATVLNKPTRLDEHEWQTMRRHARLSARLLRRFRLAAAEALSVEYHHERYDGLGYYGIESSRLPLASHFLIVADSYDAMTSDRPYRRGMAPEVALAELEKQSGTQFHPIVAKAFVAQQRGIHPLDVLTAEERLCLEHPWPARPSSILAILGKVRSHPDLLAAGSFVAALVLLALSAPTPSAAAAALGSAVLARRSFDVVCARALAARLRDVVATSNEPFDDLAGEVARLGSLRWVGVLTWREAELAGSYASEWNAGQGPSETTLSSWLIREAEADAVVSIDGGELGREGAYLAAPLRRSNGTVSYLVLGGYGRFVPRRLELALRQAREELAEALVPEPAAKPYPALAAVS